MAYNEAPLSSVLDDLKESGREEVVSAGEVLELFERRSVGVLLTLFGLLAVLPVIGDVPGASIVIGTLILITIGQSLVGGGTLWMPDFVRRREIGRVRFDRIIEKARPWVTWVDRLLKPRLTTLVAGRTQRWTVSVAAALLAVTFYPLAFVPFGVNAPALGVLALGLGLMACDGLMVLLGYVCAAVTASMLLTTL